MITKSTSSGALLSASVKPSFSDELIAAIETDISESEAILDQPECLKYKTDSFFTQCSEENNPDKADTCFSDSIKGDNLKSESVKDSI